MYNLDLVATYKIDNKNNKTIVAEPSKIHFTSSVQTWKICEILMKKSANQNGYAIV